MRDTGLLTSLAAVATPDVRPQLAAEVPGLLRCARTITRNGPSSEDLVGEALLRALQRAETSLAGMLAAT